MNIFTPIGRIYLVLFVFVVFGSVHGASGKDDNQNLSALIQHGEKYRQQGDYRQAQLAYESALTKASIESDRKAETLIKGLMGHNYLLQSDYKNALINLDQALTLAEENNWPELTALHAHYLGMYYTRQHDFKRAKTLFRNSLNWASAAKHASLIAQARLSVARLENTMEREWAKKLEFEYSSVEGSWAPRKFYQKNLALALKQENQEVIANAQSDLMRFDQETERSWLLLKAVALALPKIIPVNRIRFGLQTGYQALRLTRSTTDKETVRIQFVYKTLTGTMSLAETLKDERSQSFVLGYLGQLYSSQDRFIEGLAYTDRAVDIAQRIDAKDLLFKWEWQRGKLYKKLDKQQEALAAYRRAVNHIEAVRQDIPVDYFNGRSSFRQTLGPLYLELTDLLLQQADGKNVYNNVKLLSEARQTVELIKKTELEDYFNNRCAIKTFTEISLENIAPKTAVLYPIVLHDRLELLVSIGNRTYQQSKLVSAMEIRENSIRWAMYLRNKLEGYQARAHWFYKHLIAPIDHLLQSHDINTLVIVPDGPLRLIPMAALFDGEHYLIERFAVVTSPGLTLFDPKPISHSKIDTFLAGLSEPGPVIRTLPQPMLQNLLTSAIKNPEIKSCLSNTRDIGDTLFNRGQAKTEAEKMTPKKISELLDDPIVFKTVQAKLKLCGVNKEINDLSTLFSSQYLLNKTFVKDRLELELMETPYQVVHIASHGVFGGSSAQSFIMAYDQIISMDDLESLLSSEKFGGNPIELLTLSACQTAIGNDRSPLGISGMALKAKVRSVLGSLWSVPDKETASLMNVFYQNLKKPGVSKAAALQKAQIQIIKELKSIGKEHPYFWSPFILVGNWL